MARWISNSWLFIAFFAGCILFWQFAIDLFDIPPFILPKPTTIVEKGWADIDRLLFYTYITGSETVIGYTISVVLAVPLGLAIAFSSILRRTLYPLCVSIEMVPKIAFAPLFVSWLGFGLLPKVIIVTITASEAVSGACATQPTAAGSMRVLPKRTRVAKPAKAENAPLAAR